MHHRLHSRSNIDSQRRKYAFSSLKGKPSIVVALLLLSAAAALAAFGGFEVDANLDFNGTNIQDWTNGLVALSNPALIVANSNPPRAEDNPALPGTAILFYDYISSSGLTDLSIFTVGSKETASSVPPPPAANGVTDWAIVDGNVPPNKDDISSVYIWSDHALDNLVLGMERLNILGDSHLDFGIDHKPWVHCPDGSGALCPERTAGDLTLAYDLTNGGSLVTLRIFTWEIPGDGIIVGSTDGCDGQADIPANKGNLGKSCVGGKKGATQYGWEEISAFDPSVATHGTNANPIAAGPWGSFGPGGTPRTQIPSRGFFEAYLNLDALGFVPLCAGTATLSVRSRSSASFDSELKDLAGPIELGGGEIDGTAVVTGSCDLSFNYSATAADQNGDPVDPSELLCVWECTSSDPTRPPSFIPDECSGTASIPRGDGQPVEISCKVMVVESSRGCKGDSSADDTVLAPIIVTIAPSPSGLSCSVPGAPGSDLGDVGAGITFTPTINGGMSPYTLSWIVNGPNDASCAGNVATCSVDVPDGLFCARTNVRAHVEDGVCVGQDSNTMHVEKATTVDAKSGS